MAQIIRSLKGTRDFYPDIMAVRQWLLEKMRKVSESFGYQQYEGPCIETIDLYAAKSGDELVKEQAFVFPDRGGDLITLRPELTPTLARMVAAQQNALTFPLRWWAFGPFWRYERPQRGRTREFFQWNIDLIGSEEVLADAELIAVAASFLKEVGLAPTQAQVHVNDRRLMDKVFSELALTRDQVSAFLKLVDRIDKLPPEIWDEKALETSVSADQLRAIKDLLADEALWQRSPELTELFGLLEQLGVREYVRYDARIIRGLDYYTGVVFEAKETSGSYRAILGGGHYANLVGDVGGQPLPGVGFAMGDVVIQLVLEAHGLIPDLKAKRDAVFLTVFDAQSLPETLKLAAELRAAGLEVTVYPNADKLAKQLKYADRMGYGRALVLGPDDLARSEVQVKDLSSRDQLSVPLDQVVAHLSK